MILNLDLGQEVKESARPNFSHLSRPWFNCVDINAEWHELIIFVSRNRTF